MAFGQQTGPPASARQVDELAGLLEQAGYTSFREARHIFGLTQRQASGKFTQGEAVELIERLRSESDGGSEPSDAPPVDPGPAARRQADHLADRQAELLAKVPADDLADELVRRGWICMPPA
jgi:hypothetical protein